MWPNFFLFGAPKCGTTSMYAYLKAHPGVFMPEVKEPHYFATDLPKIRVYTSWQNYLELFDDAAGHAAVGEASTWYLYSDTAAENVLETIPSARIIVFFRNPVRFIQSLHSQFAYNAGRDPDFQAAWRSARARGLDQSRLFNAGLFGAQLRKLQAVIPPRQLHVVLLDDMHHDPGAEYRRVLDFLGLEDDGREHFAVRNANKTHRSMALARFVKRTPVPLAKGWKWVKQATGIPGPRLLDRVASLNLKEAEREPVSEEILDEVRAAYAPDIDLLQQRLGRDLSHWLT